MLLAFALFMILLSILDPTPCRAGLNPAFSGYNQAMSRITRVGFEVERKLLLNEEDDRGIVANATAAERL